MRIQLTSIYVDDQRAALAFYTDVLGFSPHHDIPVGDDFWLTVVSPDSPMSCCPTTSTSFIRASRLVGPACTASEKRKEQTSAVVAASISAPAPTR